MKSCRFHDPNYLAMYYDGTLPKDLERIFSDHLLSCSECMEALLHLEGDLFSMRSMEFEPLPVRFAGMRDIRKGAVDAGAAVFQLMRGTMKLLKNVLGKPSFQPVSLAPVRKKGVETLMYRLEKEEMTLELDADGEETFRLELSGVSGKTVTLARGDRIVQGFSGVREERVSIGNLERGEFKLSIDGKEFIRFDVE